VTGEEKKNLEKKPTTDKGKYIWIESRELPPKISGKKTIGREAKGQVASDLWERCCNHLA